MADLSRAVVERRKSDKDALDYFPTPPWATRALMEWMDARGLIDRWSSVWEPACGCGHMAEVLGERFREVEASDVADYGFGRVGSFVGAGGLGLDVIEPLRHPHWVITNPPFNLAEAFLDRALPLAAHGVALLMRTAWLEGRGRHERVFATRRPTDVIQFAGRVPMVAGRWDPAATTATAYAWFVWSKWPTIVGGTALHWIPPDAQDRLTSPGDAARFAGRMPRALEAAE